MRRAVLLLLAVMLLLTGCGTRSYVSISPHLDISSAGGGDDTLTASNYAELRGAIVRLVEQRIEEGTISLVGYSGLAEQDVRTACSEVTNNEPIGAYGVEYMSYTCVKVLANYEAMISITYSRTQAEFDAVRRISGADEFSAAVVETLADFGDTITVETSYYSAADYNVAAIIDRSMRDYPLSSVEIPDYEVSLYPSSGLGRIVEVKLEYSAPGDMLARRRDELVSAAEEIASAVDLSAGGAAAVGAVVEAVTGRSAFLAGREDDITGEVLRDSTFTAYGALVGGAAASEGYALAVSAVCGALGINCEVVEGRWNGISHRWNLVEVDEGWYHIDAALCDYYGNSDFLLKTDEEVAGELVWNAQGLPATATEPLGAEEVEPTEEPVETE